jgi:glycosyltransferase involved in cell wall biosynthesis
MTIAQVIGDLRTGGAERLFVNLANSLGSGTVVVLIGQGEIRKDLLGSLNPDIDVYEIPVRKRALISDLIRLARLFSRLNCSVVHTHMFWANLYGSIAARVSSVPVVVTSEHGRNEWKRPWHKWLERRIISRVAARRLCVSEDILVRRRDFDGVPESKLEVSPNGTPIPAIDRRPSDREPVIGSVGRLVKEKDFPTLVQAMSQLVRLGHAWRLEIVGEGPARADIEKAIKVNDASQYVELVGMQQDVGRWLQRWSVFASSSIQEGQPIALLEAMAYGLPCVATSVGGVPDTLANETEGIIVPPRDSNALAEALDKVIKNSKLRMDLGAAARQRVVQDFSIDALANRCIGIYRSELAVHGG